MNRLTIALLIGALAGLLDVLPMIAMGSNMSEMASAFLHWVVLGFVIAYIELPLPSWAKGLIVGLAAAIPVIAMVVGNDPQAPLPIIVFSAILGAGVGAATGRWANRRVA